MDEEIETPFDFLIITYSGTNTPQIRFSFGDDLRFGSSFVRRDNVWVLQVTRRQDYETLNLQQYIFDITIDGVSRTVFCTINNLIDTKPIVTLLYDGPCEVNELEEDPDTDCRLNVHDPDSLERNDLTYRILGNNNENESFDLREIERDDYSITYTLM